MSIASFIRNIRTIYFSQPVQDRALLKNMRQARWCNILQLGIPDSQRVLRLIDVATVDRPTDEIRFTGIDLFEANAAGTAKSLKDTHQLFRSRGIRVQLVPGDAGSALARVANSLSDIDLVLISADQDEASLDRAWIYLPRVLNSNCQVFREKTVDGKIVWQKMAPTELQSRADAWKKRRAA